MKVFIDVYVFCAASMICSVAANLTVVQKHNATCKINEACKTALKQIFGSTSGRTDFLHTDKFIFSRPEATLTHYGYM
jgi:hypothetical protein